jgi:tRNA uridine 5-carbamoylmethylation protein Kti12
LFNTSLEVCIERDAKRPNPIGAKVITETYNRYKEYLESNGKTN